MKRLSSTLSIPQIAAALLLAPAPAVLAQDEGGVIVPLSNPNRPATLEVSMLRGNIHIGSYDRNEILILPRDDDAEQARPRADGLHRIPNTSIELTAEERDNTVSVSLGMQNRDVALDIMVPRNTSVRARLVNGEDLTIEGVNGEHELSNNNGNIRAIDIAGSAVVNSTNGDIEVSFTEITPDKAMSFTTFNGDVEVSFPEDLTAELRLSSAGRGDVLTDFDVDVQPQAPVIDRSENGGAHRVRLEREMRAIVGGGGPEMYFKTINGDIVIRRR